MGPLLKPAGLVLIIYNLQASGRVLELLTQMDSDLLRKMGA